MRLRSILVLLAIALVVVPLAACGGDDAATATTVATTATTATPGAQPAAADAKVASKALLDAIAAGAKKDAVVRPLTGWVVGSSALPNVYFVAMEFSSSMENHQGVWATDDPEGAGTFWAVNDVAKDNTTWPKGDDAKPKITMDDPAANAALDKLTF
jgi:hypothetical protein